MEQLTWWFETAHTSELADGTQMQFRYCFAQREAVETVIWLYDVPLTPLLSDADEIVEAGLVEQALAFVQRNTAVAGHLEEGGARREEVSAYPREALREAVVNALVHRDYLLSSTDIELTIYDDRMEIVSPGRLPNGITPARMLTGCRAARNQLIKDVMRDYRYLENSGMGVPRKIVKCMREHNGTEPVLIEDGERFTLRLLR